MEELRPGLWRWNAFHPKWKQQVASLAVDTRDGLVLIDPLLGEDDGVTRPQRRVGVYTVSSPT
jgi:hypothetical protein